MSTHQNIIQNSFASGELTPALYGRTDLAKYSTGVAKLLNFICAPQGGAYRRMGTMFLNEVYDSTQFTRLLPFRFSIVQNYVLEFGNQIMRFYMNQGLILNGGTPVTLVTPWLSTDIPLLYCYTQSADTMYISHPNYQTRKLTRTSHTSWTLTILTTTDGPYLTQNTDQTSTITASALTGSVTLTATQPIFNAGQVGGLFRIEEAVAAQNTQWTYDTTYVVGDRVVNNNIVYQCTAVTIPQWNQGTAYTDGQLVFSNGRIYQSNSSATSGVTAPVQVSGNQSDGTINWTFVYNARRTAPQHVSGSVNDGRFTWQFLHGGFGIAQITAFSSSTSVTATVLNTLPNSSVNGTFNWREGAWSTYRGWPAVVCFYVDRLVFAATNNNPQTIWFSNSGDFQNYAPTSYGGVVLDTNAFAVTLNSNQVNRIQWMEGQTYLLFGTIGAEWLIQPASTNKGLAPSNVSAQIQTNYGSASLRQMRVANQIVFIERGAKKMREMVYEYTINGYVAKEISTLGEHIPRLGGGISDNVYAQGPYSIMWLVLANGEMSAVTYYKDQDLIGFSRVVLGGSFNGGEAVVESVTSIPSSTNLDDEVWVVVKRTINGVQRRYVEIFKTQFWPATPQDSSGMWYVDAGLYYDNPQTITAIANVNPCIVTVTAHGWATGNTIEIESCLGLTALNGNKYLVTVLDANRVSLTDLSFNNIDASLMGTYLGSGLARKSVTTISGLTHLAGQAVSVVVDGAIDPDITVSVGGSITLQQPGARVTVGLPFTSTLTSMNFDPQAREGTSQGQIQRVNKVIVRVLNSMGFQVGSDPNNLPAVMSLRTAAMATGKRPDLFTGDIALFTDGSYDPKNSLTFQISQAYPLNILAIMPEAIVYETA